MIQQTENEQTRMIPRNKISDIILDDLNKRVVVFYNTHGTGSIDQKYETEKQYKYICGTLHNYMLECEHWVDLTPSKVDSILEFMENPAAHLEV